MRTRWSNSWVAALGVLYLATSGPAEAGKLDKVYVNQLVTLGCKGGDPNDDYYIIPCGQGLIRGKCTVFLTQLGTCERKAGGDQALSAATSAASKCYAAGKPDASIAEALNALAAAQAKYQDAFPYLNCDRHVADSGSIPGAFLSLTGPKGQWLGQVTQFCNNQQAELDKFSGRSDYKALEPSQRAAVDKALASARAQLASCKSYIAKTLAAAAANPANAAAAALRMAEQIAKSKKKADDTKAAQELAEANRALNQAYGVMIGSFMERKKQLDDLRQKMVACDPSWGGPGLLGTQCAPAPLKAVSEMSAARAKMVECIKQKFRTLEEVIALVQKELKTPRWSKKTKCNLKALWDTAVDKLCGEFPRVCEIAREAGACIAATGKAGRTVLGSYVDLVTGPWTLDKIKALVKMDLNAISTAVKRCWESIGNIGRTVATAVKEWLCAGETRGFICDQIAAARDCYNEIKKRLPSLPGAIAKKINWLQMLAPVNPLQVPKAIYEAVQGPEFAPALAECKKWVVTTIGNVAKRYCEKNPTCRALLEELEKEGVTVANWSGKLSTIARVALRLAFRQKGSYTLALRGSASAKRIIYKVLGGKGEGSVSVTVSNAGGDNYILRFSLSGGAAVNASVGNKSGNVEGGIALGGSIEGSRTLRLNAASGADWNMLMMLGVDTALRGAVRLVLGPLNEIAEMFGLVDKVEKLIVGEEMNTDAIIARLGSGSGCKACGYIEGEVKAKLETFGVGGTGKAQLCFEAEYRQGASEAENEIDLKVSQGLEGGGGLSIESKDIEKKLEDAKKTAVARASGVLKALGGWFGKQVAAVLNAPLERFLNVKVGLGGSFGKTVKGVKVPKGQLLDCAALGREFLGNWAKTVGTPSQSWTASITFGAKDTWSGSLTLSAGEMVKPKKPAEYALLALGPIGTFALFMMNGNPGTVVSWKAGVTEGKTWKKSTSGQVEVGISASASHSYVAGSGTWTLADLKNGTLRGALSFAKSLAKGE
jgi:hypothetical protein